MMDRRGFFRKSLFGLRDRAVRNVPASVREQVGTSVIDISILTEFPDRADELCADLLEPHITGTVLRLRRAQLSGMFPGGIVLFENNRRVDYHDGISLLYAGLRQIAVELRTSTVQSHPTLVRYMNITPPFSRTVEIWRGSELLHALPLAESGHFPVMSACGPMLFEIQHGRCAVIESSCTHGTCKAHPAIVAPGERIICVPGDVTALIGTAQG